MDTLNILAVIDMQKDFVDGSLGSPEAVAIVDNVVELIGQYDAANVYATRDTHPANYLETAEGSKLPVEHCIEGTDGWQLNEKIAAALGDAVIVDKPTFGSFELTDLIAARVREHGGPAVVTVVGLCTDICVVSNVLMLKAALYEEAAIRVVRSCCAGVTPELHEAALTTMASCQIDII